MLRESQSNRAHDREVLDSQITQLSVQVADLNERLRLLRCLRNVTAPILSLPDELLSLIFFNYAHLQGIFETRRWVKITFVCRKFRNVALNDARLWSYFSNYRYDTPENISAFLYRSRAHPLACKLTTGLRDSYYYATHFVGQHAHRIRSLAIYDLKDKLDFTFLPAPAFPLLRDLNISVLPESAIPDEQTWELPEYLIDSGPPLRTLALKLVNFSQWSQLSNLTVLSLYRIPLNNPVSFDKVFSALQRCPALRSLKLHHYLPPSDGTSLAAQEVLYQGDSLALPDLEDLDLAGFYPPIAALIKRLVVPVKTTLTVHAVDVHHGNELSTLLVWVRRHLHRADAPAIRAMYVHRGPLSSLYFGADSEPRKLSDYIFGLQHSRFTLTTYPGTQRAVRGILTRVLNAIPLEHAAYLDCLPVAGPELSRQTWRAFFHHVPYLEAIHMGVNEGLVLLLGGLMDAIQIGERGLSGKKRRRAGQGYWSWPSKLQLMVCYDGVHDAIQIETDAQAGWYDSVEARFIEYRNTGTMLKPLGRAWPTLVMEDFRRFRTVHNYKARLGAVVQELVWNDQR
ncbi:hypothetical protein FA95DRAFT_1609480 [Auriscalpium vulgare]|uniref:Uncharacterized protein n=1 Tax=Auriscalpium vulgare TaxID=40419 RepID=A0ACB8RI96_9AGAM|nr:hypothetical protein FA95DRAFT_1609480 [Auriscalpium vulgare]